jgi:hypothetical protein
VEHPAKEHGYITTFSGQPFRSLTTECSFAREDMSHALSMICRYLGHVRDFYSVAEHSVLVSVLAEANGEPLVVQQCAFLHDAHEAYCGDFPSPFKLDLPEHEEWERRIQRVVRADLGLPTDEWIWRRVKVYDTQALHLEAHYLLPDGVRWVDHDLATNLPTIAHIWAHDPKTARYAFKQRAAQLGLEGF